MEENSNDILNNISSMFEDKSTVENLSNILKTLNIPNEDTNKSNETQNKNTAQSSNFSASNDSFSNIDINTILKIKKLMDTMNNQSNDSRSNLLLSLKPYVSNKKKAKIDDYIKYLQYARLFENMTPFGGDTNINE